LLIPVSNASAIPTTTLAGESSIGKCKEGGEADLFRPHYALVNPNRPDVFVTGQVFETDVSYEDVFFDHYSHDNTFKVLLNNKSSEPFSRLETRDYDLNSPSNSKDDKGNLLMEMELEINYENNGGTERFPKEFWPFGGDLVSMKGRYIFDCGHPEKGPRTEIHPPSTVAFTRFEPMIFASVGSDPLLASQTLIFINGNGGVFTPDLNDLNNPDLSLLDPEIRNLIRNARGESAEVDAATISEYIQRASGDDINVEIRKLHRFDIPLPAKPSQSSKLVIQTDTSFGGIAPKITGPFQTAEGKPYLHVDIDLRQTGEISSDKYGTHISAAWRDPPQPNTYHHLRIQIDSIQKMNSILNREFTPVSGPAWLIGDVDFDFKNLWLGINGEYKEILGPTIGEFSSTRSTQPKVFNPPITYDVIVAEEGPGSKLNIKSTGYISSTMDGCFQPNTSQCNEMFLLGFSDRPTVEEINRRQKIKEMEIEFSKDNNFGIGPPISQCSSVPECEFRLTYSISELQQPTTIAQPMLSPSPDIGTPPPTTIAPPLPSPNSNQAQTCDPKSPQLKIRSEGEKVMELQSYLKQLGYGDLLGDFGPNHDGIDGKFGEATKKAVMKFQQDKHLKVDGIVGPNTWGAICTSMNSLTTPTGFEIQPKVNYISVEQTSEPQQSIPILPETSASVSEPSVDPTEDPGVEIIEEEGSDQALGIAFPSINNTEILSINNTNGLQLVGNTSSQQIPQVVMQDNQSKIIVPGQVLGNKSIATATNQTEEVKFGTSGNFTQPQQPLVDEFGNVIPSDNITAVDNFTQPSLQQQPLVDEFGNVIPTQPPSDNFTTQQFPTDNFTTQPQQLQPSLQQQPLVDEFGNVIPTQPLIDNFTQPLQPPEVALPAQIEICDNFVDDDGDGLADFDDPEGCSPT